MTISAGIVVFRRRVQKVEVLLVHPAGPLWGHKDCWTIPKGRLADNEEIVAAAYREFEEEVGMRPPDGGLISLGSIPSGNLTNYIWAVEGEVDLSKFSSNSFIMEWPPKSGVQQEYPETDRAEWFDLVVAKRKLFNGQVAFIDRLARHVNV